MEKFASPVGFFKGGGAGGGGSVSLLLIYKKKKIQLKFPQIIFRRFGPHDVPCDVIGTRVRPKPSSSHVSSSERSHLPTGVTAKDDSVRSRFRQIYIVSHQKKQQHGVASKNFWKGKKRGSKTHTFLPRFRPRCPRRDVTFTAQDFLMSTVQFFQ